MYHNILIPGRHHLLTNFQHQYLQEMLTKGHAITLDGQTVQLGTKPKLIWAITSANHNNTRRNPLPANRREQAIELFCEDLSAQNFTFSINDIGYTDRFADFLIKDINVSSRGLLELNPSDTLVLCSTPSVIEMYEKLGYKILPAELSTRQPEEYSHKRPWDLVLSMVAAGEKWQEAEDYKSHVHAASQLILQKYRLGDLIIEVHQDPLLGDEGDITATRNYEQYKAAFEAVASYKYSLVKSYIRRGRIVDIGCATGEIIKEMDADPELFESDIYGIEASRWLYSICEQRRQNGEFKNDNVFFYQRNFMSKPLFPANSVDTTTSFALTHEIFSYLGADALNAFLQRVYEQTAPGGIYINLDVVGPPNKHQAVIMKLKTDDGRAEQPSDIADKPKLDSQELSSLSTLSRFYRFAQDFRPSEAKRVNYREASEYGPGFIELSLEDACEFISKKDYTDSWYSEMQERFCFWDFSHWTKALNEAGFALNSASHAFRNEWLVENRWRDSVEFFHLSKDKLKPMDYPVSHVLLLAEKQL